jgi:hypothetical protein
MKKKNNHNDSFDKRDDDEMEDISGEGENEKDFNPDILDDALTEEDTDDEFEHDSLEDEKENEDDNFNNEEESPLWKL